MTEQELLDQLKNYQNDDIYSLELIRAYGSAVYNKAYDEGYQDGIDRGIEQENEYWQSRR